MRTFFRPALALAAALTAVAAVAHADVTPTVDRIGGNDATDQFDFKTAPTPVGDDLATKAKFTLIDGATDGGGVSLDSLHDGKLPSSNDDPQESFFFGAGTVGGRFLVDLGKTQDIGQINTYSWHAGERAPQVYTVYAAEGTEPGLNLSPKMYVDPAQAGWTKVADVDTRERGVGQRRRARGGQVAVSLNDNDFGSLGNYRYVLFDVKHTDPESPYANTFFSEVDVVATDKIARLKPSVAPVAANQRYKIIIDTDGLSPEMVKWAHENLEPVCKEWYPKIVEMLPSDGYRAPKTFRIGFRDDMGNTPAMAGGTQVSCNLPWFEKNQHGEGIGAVVHEMVHVVQQYRFGAKQVPFWLQEGIPDYVRWYLYEPQSKGARVRDIEKAKYDAAYRTSANFLNYVSNTYGKDIVPKVNAAVRSGKYNDDMWKGLCKGKDLKTLEAEWKEQLKSNPD